MENRKWIAYEMISAFLCAVPALGQTFEASSNVDLSSSVVDICQVAWQNPCFLFYAISKP
jgi:hypothetical protein